MRLFAPPANGNIYGEYGEWRRGGSDKGVQALSDATVRLMQQAGIEAAADRGVGGVGVDSWDGRSVPSESEGDADVVGVGDDDGSARYESEDEMIVDIEDDLR